MIIAIILIIAGSLSLLLGLAGIAWKVNDMRNMFLPNASEISAVVILLLIFLAVSAGGVTMLVIGIRKRKKSKSKIAHQRAMRKTGTENPEMEKLSAPSGNLTEATNKILTYLYLETTFLKPELQEIASTLGSLSGIFANTKAVLARRFSGGITATKYQTGLDGLLNAVLTRIDMQISQLCAVDENSLQKKAERDEECKQSLDKLLATINGTKNLMDKTVGLVSRLALEAIDCTEDVLEKEAVHISELVKELGEYK